MNTDRKMTQPAETTEGKCTKQDIWGLLITFGMVLAALLIRYLAFMPRFL